MSRVLLAVAIDDWDLGPLGVKEAVVMALEHLGGVRVLSVELQEPEQTSMRAWPENPSRPKPPAPKPPPPKPVGQALARKSPRPQPPLECCFNCARYRSDRNLDANGNLYWGVCGHSGRMVYDLKKRCPAWVRLGR